MGLDITAYERVEKVPLPSDPDAAYDNGIRQICSDGFDERLGSLEKDGWYSSLGEEIKFRAGSYSGYSWWRNALAVAALGVTAQHVWRHREQYVGKPFYELIDFSDCEGAIGPEVCAKLAGDFAENRERVLACLPKTDTHEYFASLYDEWAAAFALAASGGMVDFH